MSFSKHPILRVLPALLMMAAIFLFSARPSFNEQSTFWHYLAFKSGHVIGYAMLTLSLWRAFNFGDRQIWLAWLIAFLYAVTDEIHQSFVPGRHSAVSDVIVYDNLGALISIWFAKRIVKQKQPARDGLVVKPATAKN